jgi:hypothetical protein
MSALRVFAAVYLVMIAVILAAPLIGPEGYSALRHTTSELAAQNAPNAWVMRGVFVALGGSALAAVWPVLGGLMFHRAALAAFAVSVAMTGVVSHAPIMTGVPFDATEDLWHSRFADATGASFTMLAAAMGFVEPTPRRRALAIAVAGGAVALSVAMAASPEFRGLFQRMIFIGGFGWLVLLARWRGAH